MTRAGTCNDASGSHACELPPGHEGLHVCVGRYEDPDEDVYADRDDWWDGPVFIGPPPPEGWNAPEDCCAAWDETGRRVRGLQAGESSTSARG